MIGQLIELRPRCFGRSEGWYWMVPCVGTREELLRDDQGDEGHHLEVGREGAELVEDVRVAERSGLEDGEPGGKAGLLQGIGLAAGPLRRCVHGDDLVAAGEQRLEHRLAERLLPVHHDAHPALPASANTGDAIGVGGGRRGEMSAGPGSGAAAGRAPDAIEDAAGASRTLRPNGGPSVPTAGPPS